MTPDMLGPWRGARTRRIWPAVAEVLAIIGGITAGTLPVWWLLACWARP